MAEKSAIAKLREKRAREAKEYKTTHDPQRVHHLIAAASLIRDWPAASALAASLSKELAALNLKQMELDEKEKEEQQKETAEAMAADAKAGNGKESPHVEEDESPLRAPSVPRR